MISSPSSAPARRRPNISSTEWDKHKQTIITLYLSHPLEDVVKKLTASPYHFPASKSQYPRKLKEWRVSKYNKREIWEYIAKQLEIRGRPDLAFEVLIEGIRIPRKKVLKEVSRHKTRQLNDPTHEESISVPIGVEIREVQPQKISANGSDAIHRPEDIPDGVLILHRSQATRLEVPATTSETDSHPFGLAPIYAIADAVLKGLLAQIRDDLREVSQDRTEAMTVRLLNDAVVLLPFDLSKHTSSMADHKEIATDMRLFQEPVWLALRRAGLPSLPLPLHAAMNSQQILPSVVMFITSAIYNFVNKLMNQDILPQFCAWTREQGKLVFYIYQNCSGAATCDLLLQSLVERNLILGLYCFRSPFPWLSSTTGTYPGAFEVDDALLDNGLPASLLQLAIRHHQVSVVEVLLKIGADPNKAYGSTLPPLFQAIEGGDSRLGVALSLLAAGASVVPYSLQETPHQARFANPLVRAVRICAESLPHRLLAAGARARVLDASLGSDFCQAAEHGTLQIMRAMLRSTSLPDGVLLYTDPDQAGELISETCPSNCLKYFGSALQCAILAEREDMAKLLLESGANVNPIALPAHFLQRNNAIVEKMNQHFKATTNMPVMTPLQAAVFVGNKNMMRLCLEMGADPNGLAFENFGETPFQIAVRRICIEAMFLLVDAGADVNSPAGTHKQGRTALQIAAECGNKGLVEILLELGAQVNARPGPFDGVTSLEAAILSGEPAIVADLILSGANVNEPLTQGRSSGLLIALEAYDNLDVDRSSTSLVVDLLLMNGAKPNVYPTLAVWEHPLLAAARTSNISFVKKLLKAGSSLEFLNTEQAMIPEVGKSQFNLIKLMCEHGGWELSVVEDHHIVSKGKSNVIFLIRLENILERTLTFTAAAPLVEAEAASGASQVLDKLRERTQLWHVFRRLNISAMLVAARSGRSDLLKRLISVTDVEQLMPWQKMLFEAAASYSMNPRFHDFKTFKILIDRFQYHGCRIEFGDSMEIAALQSDWETVKLLISYQANANGDERNVPLCLAIKAGKYEIAEQLLRTGASANSIITVSDATDSTETTAIQLAAQSGNVALVEQLLVAGASINLPPGTNGTALQVAARCGHLQIVETLLRAGADSLALDICPKCKIRSCCGCALCEAANNGRLDVVHTLLRNDTSHKLTERCRNKAANLAERAGHLNVSRYIRRWRTDPGRPKISHDTIPENSRSI